MTVMTIVDKHENRHCIVTVNVKNWLEMDLKEVGPNGVRN